MDSRGEEVGRKERPSATGECHTYVRYGVVHARHSGALVIATGKYDLMK